MRGLPPVPDLDARTLKEWLARGRAIYLLDVRTPEEFADWRIPTSQNLPLERLLAGEGVNSIPRDRAVVAVCAHGTRARQAAEHLLRFGIRVYVLSGGMAAWNTVYDIAEVMGELPARSRVIQVRRLGKGCTSYVIASDGEAAVVDPTCHVEHVLDVARQLGARITHILDTHQHADHVSGARRLQTQTGATLHLSPHEGYAFRRFEPLVEGREIRVGSVHLRPIHAPGHTLGSMLIEVSGRLLLTGDTLFVEGVGRPDLRDRAEEFAELLDRTYRTVLSGLPDRLLVLPGHLSPDVPLRFGEALGASLGELKRKVLLFGADRKAFIRYLLERVPERPPNTRIILRMNREGVICSPAETDRLEEGPNRCAVPAADSTCGR